MIPPATARRLLAELVRVDVFALVPMIPGVSDLPSARLEGMLNGRPVSVLHYGGGEDLALGYRDPTLVAVTRLELLVDLTSEAEPRVIGCTTPSKKRDEPGPRWAPGKKLGR